MSVGTVFSNKWRARGFSVLLGLGAWLGIAYYFPMGLFPGPFDTVVASIELLQSGIVWEHLEATLVRTFAGFLGAAILGVGLGVAMGIHGYSEHFITPYIIIALSVPGIAWAAIITIIFGFGFMGPVLATTLTVFPYIALRVWKGVENIDTDVIEMSHSFGISRRRLVRRMILPSVAPALFTAARFGLAISWKVETQAEIFASNTGVGIRSLEAFSRYQYSRAMAWAVVFVVIILALEVFVIRPLERRMFEYRQDANFDVL